MDFQKKLLKLDKCEAINHAMKVITTQPEYVALFELIKGLWPTVRLMAADMKCAESTLSRRHADLLLHKAEYDAMVLRRAAGQRRVLSAEDLVAMREFHMNTIQSEKEARE